MSNIVESKSQIQIGIPLTDEAKLKCSRELINAMNDISAALDDMKDYQTEKKEDIEKFEGEAANARRKASDNSLSDEAKLACTDEMVNAMNAISEIEDDLRSYQTEKKAEIAKNEAIKNICLTKINRGKDFKWVEVKVIKDFDKKKKTFARIDTGEIVKVLPLSEDDLQMPLEEKK